MSGSTYVKVDEDLVSLAIGVANNEIGEANGVLGKISGYVDAAHAEVNSNLNYALGLRAEPAADAETSEWDAYNSYQNACREKARNNHETIEAQQAKAVEYIGNVIKKLSAVVTELSNINKAISTFNGDVRALIKTTFETYEIKTTEVENANGGVTFVVTCEIGDEVYTVSELLNAFFTYTGMSMSVVVQGALLATELGYTSDEYATGDFGDKIRNAMLQQVGALTTFAAQTRAYSLATEQDIQNVASSLGINVGTYSSAESLVSSDEERKKYSDALGKASNSNVTINGATVFSGAMGAYALAAFIDANPNFIKSSEETASEQKGEASQKTVQENTQTTSPSGSSSGSGYSGGPSYYGGGSNGGGSNGGGSSGGGGSGGGGNGGSSAKAKKPAEKETVVGRAIASVGPPKVEGKLVGKTEAKAIPGIVEPIKGYTGNLETPIEAAELPTEVVDNPVEKNYDDLARLEYESQGTEAIEAHRSELYALADQLFKSEDKTELVQKLREYGYSDEDIGTIITDMNLTVNAIMSGDERAELTKIAQELAAKDGVEAFDTIYDNAQTLASLTDGTTVKLLANMSSDENVKSALLEISTASTVYNEATVEANKAITAVNVAKEKLDTLQLSLDEEIKINPAQWDSVTLAAYNKEVKALYRSTVENAGKNIRVWSAEDLEKYTNATKNARDAIALSKGQDTSKWSNEDMKKYDEMLDSIDARYEKAYGEDRSKWSSSISDKYYNEVKIKQKRFAKEVGYTLLTEADNKTISEKAQKTIDNLIKKNGDSANWTAEQQKEYETKVEEIRNKYAADVSTKSGKAVLRDEQAAQYNEAVKEYNAAVELAKTAVEKQTQAKEELVAAQGKFDEAKEKFYANLLKESDVGEPAISNVELVDVNQESSGDLNIAGSVSVTPDGGAVTNDGNATGEGVSGGTANAGGTEERVVSDDPEPVLYADIPVMEVSSDGDTLGNVSNESIQNENLKG